MLIYIFYLESFESGFNFFFFRYLNFKIDLLNIYIYIYFSTIWDNLSKIIKIIFIWAVITILLWNNYLSNRLFYRDKNNNHVLH